MVTDHLPPAAGAAFAAADPSNGVTSLLGVYAFAFRIFGDFARCSAIAIGAALLTGMRLRGVRSTLE